MISRNIAHIPGLSSILFTFINNFWYGFTQINKIISNHFPNHCVTNHTINQQYLPIQSCLCFFYKVTNENDHLHLYTYEWLTIIIFLIKEDHIVDQIRIDHATCLAPSPLRPNLLQIVVWVSCPSTLESEFKSRQRPISPSPPNLLWERIMFRIVAIMLYIKSTLITVITISVKGILWDRRWSPPSIGIFSPHMLIFFYRNAFLIMKLSKLQSFRVIRALIASQSTFEK